MKQTKSLIIVAVITALFVFLAAGLYSGALSTTGSFSSLDRCEEQRDTLLDGYYVACTPCSQDYSSGGVWYAAGCFLSGTKGERCLAGGGVCSDTSCSVCDNVEVCRETDDIVFDDGDSVVYEVSNWGDVCDKTVFQIVCYDSDLDGKEYSTRVSTLGECVDTPEVVIPDPVVIDYCAGVLDSKCDGFTFYDEKRVLGNSCEYEVVEVNSAACGYSEIVDPEEVNVDEVVSPPIVDDVDDDDEGFVDNNPNFLERLWAWLKGLFKK